MLTLLASLVVAVGCLAVATGTIETLGGVDDPDDAGESGSIGNADDPSDPESVDNPDDADTYDYVVAQDGSGDYEATRAAIDNAKSFPPERIRILARNGVYDGKVEICTWDPNITLVGEGAEEMVTTHDDHFERVDCERNSTFFIYALKVRGNGFRARDLTAENSTGPVGQAIAFYVDADRAVFENCHFFGRQNTIYAASEGAYQYLSDCYVEGATDFIFGGATAVFEDYHAHSRTDSYVMTTSVPVDEPFGLVFLDYKLTADPDVSEVHLGRLWRSHARTALIRTWADPHVRSDRWHNWSRPDAEATVEYTEFDSRGPGAEGERVSWATTLTENEAAQYSRTNVLGSTSDGEQWNWEE